MAALVMVRGVVDAFRLACCRYPTCAWFCSRLEQRYSACAPWSRVDRCLRASELRWALHGCRMLCWWRPRRVVYRILPLDSPVSVEHLDTLGLRGAESRLADVEQRAKPAPVDLDVEALERAIERATAAGVSSGRLAAAVGRLKTARKVQASAAALAQRAGGAAEGATTPPPQVAPPRRRRRGCRAPRGWRETATRSKDRTRSHRRPPPRRPSAPHRHASAATSSAAAAA